MTSLDDHRTTPEKSGDEIPAMRVTPDRWLTVRYAGASGDYNPIHVDDDFARAGGLPGRILHGLYTMALTARAATATTGGDPRALAELSVQFRGIGRPEEEIVITGAVAEVEPDAIVVDVRADQSGRTLVRNARARLRR